MAIEINSMLRVYDEDNLLEMFRKGYRNQYCNSVMWQNGDYIPSWFFETSETVTTVYLESLDVKKLKNGIISELSSEDITTGGYTTDKDNGKIHASKQSETLSDNSVYRLKIGTSNQPVYTEIFKNI